MRIIKLMINNFRNLNDIEMDFYSNISFLVGENNLGKSNLLDLLDIIFNKRYFNEDDFLDKEKPIEIEIFLKLEDIEIGVFEDLFDPEQNNIVNIQIIQESPDEDIKYFHKETGEKISYLDVRCANFIKYDSLRTPKDELSFYRQRGVGKFLSYLVKKYFKNKQELNSESFIKRDFINEIIDYINQHLKKIEMFEKFKILTNFEERVEKLIYRILTIKDEKGFEIQKLGYGVQFLILIVLSILEKIMYLLDDKRRERCIYNTGDENKRYISLILGLDEPEIHLHPYMQRNLIKYINNILSNKDTEFTTLLKELFDIDGILGQAIIVTHSPNILLNDYKQIIRFSFSKEGSVKVKSGANISLDPQKERDFLKNLPYIKEAFFSKCVIIVEGETEFGCLPVWGEKVLGDIDKYGINIIKAGGKGSAVPIAELLEQFNISSVPIVDRDAGSSKIFSTLVITNKRDFEEELVDNLLIRNKKLLFEIVKEFDGKGLEREIQKNKLDKITKKYNLNITWTEGNYKFSMIKEIDDDNLTKAMFLSWFDINKSIIFGRVVGNKVDSEYIPEPYCNAIIMAMELSENE